MNKSWFIVIIFFLVIVQVSFYFEYLSHLVPDLSFLLLVLYALNVKRKEEASAVAVVVGLFQDLLIGRALGPYALAKLLVVYWSGWLGEKDILEGNPPGVFITLVIFNLLYWFILWLIYITSFQVDILFHSYLWDHLFFQSVLAGVLGTILNPKIKGIVKKRGHLFPYR